jgi:hypothetical protein
MDNNVIRFIDVKKKKEGLFANFKAKGTRNGVSFTASISVDTNFADVDPADPLEKIIEECAELSETELKKFSFKFEGLVEL